MKNTYIKFLTEEDRAQGFRELSARAQIIGLVEEIFCVPVTCLSVLDEQNICYALASNEEVTQAEGRTWRFVRPENSK
ncbi:MAG TPA: hypothetical protein VFW40_00735 [Capsulimonadaceae bacterium]|nr:hypothetical protein [Capsulimonadaceae bacterium]